MKNTTSELIVENHLQSSSKYEKRDVKLKYLKIINFHS